MQISGEQGLPTLQQTEFRKRTGNRNLSQDSASTQIAAERNVEEGDTGVFE